MFHPLLPSFRPFCRQATKTPKGKKEGRKEGKCTEAPLPLHPSIRPSLLLPLSHARLYSRRRTSHVSLSSFSTNSDCACSIPLVLQVKMINRTCRRVAKMQLTGLIFDRRSLTTQESILVAFNEAHNQIEPPHGMGNNESIQSARGNMDRAFLSFPCVCLSSFILPP